jgi:hypothetical protein
MGRHLYRSDAGLSAGWSLKKTQLWRSSNLIFDLPVVPNAGRGMYLCSWLVDHREGLSPNSHRVINNRIPTYLRIHPDVIGVLHFACSSRLVSHYISCSCKGGNERRNRSRAERPP